MPQEWREATVFPLFKKGDPSSVSNYRPISLTCTQCKVMESIIKDSLLSFAQANNIFSPCQHGFVPGKSTCTHLLESHFDWCSGLDKREFFDAVTIDFKKAFDVVPHHKLLLKLTSIGLCGKTIEWIKSFLANRKQRVRINKEFSSEAGVSSGVIQGSTLGPILFAFYINDLPEACHGCTVEMFADDVIVYKCIRDSTHRSCLQAALDSLLSWTTKWCLDLSTDKCYYFQIGYSNYVLLYHLGPDILHPCQSIVDLGVTVAANCFVYTLELKLFQLLGRTPKLWIRFIDDIFIMDTFDNLHPDIILNNLNNLYPNIHVTSTLAKNTEKTTNFVDISIQINQGHLQTGLYRKPTHCGSVLDFYSHHADSFKYSVAIGQFKHVKTLSNTTETQELSFNIIRETLRSSHYPEYFIEK